MERNTILAVVLSALVLFGYQAIFVSPKQPNSLNVGADLVSTRDKGKPTNASPANELKPNNTFVGADLVSARYNSRPSVGGSNPAPTADYKIKTTETELSYTNVGGTLHNIDFLGNDPFPITEILNVEGLENVQYVGEKVDKQTVSLTYSDRNWQITKTFELKGKNLIKARMDIKNLSEMSILNNFNFTAFEIDESRMDINQNSRENALFEYSVYAKNKI